MAAGKVVAGVAIVGGLGVAGYLGWRWYQAQQLKKLDAKLPGSGSLEDKLKALGVEGCKKLVASQGGGSLSGLCKFALLPQVLSKAPVVAKMAGKAAVAGAKAVGTTVAKGAGAVVGAVGSVVSAPFGSLSHAQLKKTYCSTAIFPRTFNKSLCDKYTKLVAAGG